MMQNELIESAVKLFGLSFSQSTKIIRVLPYLSTNLYNKLNSKSISSSLLGNNLTKRGVGVGQVSGSIQRGVADSMLPCSTV